MKLRTVDAISLFITSRQHKGLSPVTIKWYREILLSFAARYPKLPSNPTDIERFTADRPVGDERRHGYYRAIKCLYRFLHRRLNIKNPVELIDPPRCVKKQPVVLSPQEINQLLCSQSQDIIKAAILFMVDTGARLGECAGLKVEDLNEYPDGFIARITGKTGARIVPIGYETYHTLMVSLPFTHNKDWLCRHISQTLKEAGLKGTAHTLRHSFATLWQGDELTLQEIMGHTNLATTRLYRHLRTDMLIRQHNQYSPLRMVSAMSRSML